MRYVKARIEQESEAMAYRFYIAEGIKATANNCSKMNGGVEITRSFAQVLDGMKNPDNRTAEDIKQHIKNKLQAFAES